MSGKYISMSRWDCIFPDATSGRKVLHCRPNCNHSLLSHHPMNGNASQLLLLLHYDQQYISIWTETTRPCAHIQYSLRKICISNSRMELKIEFLIKMCTYFIKKINWGINYVKCSTKPGDIDFWWPNSWEHLTRVIIWGRDALPQPQDTALKVKVRVRVMDRFRVGLG